VPTRPIAEIRGEIEDVKQALATIDHHLRDARYAASALICDAVEAEYRARVASICGDLVKLYRSRKAYTEMIDALEIQGVAWSRLHPMQPTFLGDAHETSNSRIALYLRDAEKAGFISQKDIPEDIR
jgi:hypothetical protein